MIHEPALGRSPSSGLHSYIVSDTELAMGASLGNGAIWVTTKGTGAIERVFSARVGESLFGAVSVRYGLMSRPLDVPPAAGAADGATIAVPLRADGGGSVELHPAYQRRSFTLAGTIEVSETTFVPLCDVATPAGDPPVVYVRVELRNVGPASHFLRASAFARLRGSLAADVRATFDAGCGALVAVNASRPNATRCFGVVQAAARYATTADFGSVYDPLQLGALDDDTTARGDILGALQVDLELAPGTSETFAFLCAAFDTGEAEAIAAYRAIVAPDVALATTVAHLEEILHVSEVLTPQREINLGALWSKVNMRRVMSRYARGDAFTNEPGMSSNVVGRDVAWFVYGNDHFMPNFSRSLLDTLAEMQYPDGKIPEYYDAIDGRVEDDGLNINDDTPLFVLAVNHHVRSSGDLAWLRRIYPSVARAARYITSQIDARGLVFCTARDPRGNVWAIAGWRNVIPGYTLNGAVTEINAECVAALRAAAHLAENLGSQPDDAAEFSRAYRALAESMDRHLINPANGLYYLNIDADGAIHTDVTGDEIFPVMFRVCNEETGFRIVSRLNAPDFWTEAGLRTVSRDDPLYDPTGNVGLLGGVWPGLTWWYAFAAARYHPEFMVRALSLSFAHYAAEPKKNNTVPGQFGEYFDGESLINRGMRLSPWEPPRFLWAAIEGVCGVSLTTGALQVNPLVPPSWKWLALKRLPYHDGEITYFAVREGAGFQISATGAIETEHPIDRYDEDVSPDVHVFSRDAVVVALRRRDEICVLVGNVAAQSVTAALTLATILDPQSRYDVCLYDSERRAWQPGRILAAREAGSQTVSIEMGGFRVIALSRIP